jgi:hypothetical protein
MKCAVRYVALSTLFATVLVGCDDPAGPAPPIPARDLRIVELDPRGLVGIAADINDRGQVVGQSGGVVRGSIPHAVLWTRPPN